jgi:signal transduction histidine kinase/CheY-like chemotaxis protein/HPt (histidine-containing phosphotransfer) domain-containing protein
MEGEGVSSQISVRARELFEGHIDGMRRRVDRLFAWLIAGQWVFAIALALGLSPYTWEGTTRSVHPHVLAAVLLGGAISSFPIAMAWLRPGSPATRYAVAAAQMLWSGLLIHITGGRIETHFHVFGSLAFLAFYRDWRVFVPATAVVAGDHLIRQIFWPESVYGILDPEWWRVLEHAGWVVFEDVFLVFSCVRGVAELENLARQRAEIEDVSRKERERSEQLDCALGDALAARDTAEKANHIKGQFLANMSHELRTPINGITGMTELMGRTELSPKQRQYAETIRRSGETLLTVVNDILDFSKMEAGKLTLEATELDVAATTSNVVEMLGPSARAKGLALEHTVGDLPSGFGDAGRLQQVLSNLVANAIKFTERGKVTLRASVTEQTDEHAVVRFEVGDTGIGIGAADVPRLFRAFSQVDGSNSRKYGGTGLGLAIAKQLAEMMGGEIGVSSVLGEGSTFWFTIRMAKRGRPAVPVQADTGPAQGPLSRRERNDAPELLMAEDNVVNQQVGVEMLEALGYKVTLVSNGRAALDALGTRSYSAVLMDCQMPEMNGYDATREIRRREQGARRTPIVAVTAHAMVGDREKALAAGMDDYLTKPLTMAKLADVIARWVPDASAEGVNAQPAEARSAGVPQALDRSVRRSKKVIELFLGQMSAWSARVASAISAGDVTRLKEEAHQMKGSCLSIGAVALAGLCRELELEPARAAQLRSPIETASVALRAALESELVEQSAATGEKARV